MFLPVCTSYFKFSLGIGNYDELYVQSVYGSFIHSTDCNGNIIREYLIHLPLYQLHLGFHLPSRAMLGKIYNTDRFHLQNLVEGKGSGGFVVPTGRSLLLEFSNDRPHA